MSGAMAGAMRKMAVYLGLVEDEEGEGYDYEGYDEPAAAHPVPRRAEPVGATAAEAATLHSTN